METTKKEKRIEELEEMKTEFILNESVLEDENPSWGEIAEAQAVAEKKWNKTDNGKKLTWFLKGKK